MSARTQLGSLPVLKSEQGYQATKARASCVALHLVCNVELFACDGEPGLPGGKNAL